MSEATTGLDLKAKLTVKVTSNPKKVGSKSHGRFEGYFRLGKEPTVEDALKTGVSRGDIRHDVSKGFIEVVGMEGPPATTKTA